MSGFLTNQRLWGVTTFFDHISDLVYVHLMRYFSLAETLLEKAEMEKTMAQAGWTVLHYHADNGRFSDNCFVEAINSKDQNITFYGVGTHHQNGIVKNKKLLTNGALTLLLHGIRMWLQMIDEMFWPFAIKDVAERHNILHVDHKGLTSSSILHGVYLEDIPVKYFHTLFCPIYALDARLQSAGGAGPPKWEPRSRIGVYLGHSPFHARSVALVWNPNTGRVSPQYHVVFDDDFSTVTFMETGKIPTNWEDLVKYSSERATTKYVTFSDTWLNRTPDMGATDHLSDTFAVVTDHQKSRKTTNHGNLKKQNAEQPAASKGDRSPLSQLDNLNQDAANSFMSTPKQSTNIGRAGVQTDIFDSKPTTDSDSLKMPTRMNPHENGLRRSPLLREQRDMEESQNQKAHVTFGTAAATKVVFGMFLLIALASNITMPEQRTHENITYTDQVMNWSHEVNELTDGTLNKIHHFMYSTDINTKKCFTFRNTMKQEENISYVEAMEEEISDHEAGVHCSVVHRDTLHNKARPIKTIWSFKRKMKPDGELFKHKAHLCAHGGIQK